MSSSDKCVFCSTAQRGGCELAVKKVIDGKEYTFCCDICASKFEKKS
ncbi:hypothetical protein [[Eubacterium] cellulosolvens]